MSAFYKRERIIHNTGQALSVQYGLGASGYVTRWPLCPRSVLCAWRLALCPCTVVCGPL
jgi:hypothetical protein